MIVVATYDISADSRRSRVAALLQSWGDRVQRSVYVLDITAATLDQIRARCAGIMDLDVDSLYFMPMCAQPAGPLWTTLENEAVAVSAYSSSTATTTYVGQGDPPERFCSGPPSDSTE
jgi:CRISPR-associated protein Cas2